MGCFLFWFGSGVFFGGGLYFLGWGSVGFFLVVFLGDFFLALVLVLFVCLFFI